MAHTCHRCGMTMLFPPHLAATVVCARCNTPVRESLFTAPALPPADPQVLQGELLGRESYAPPQPPPAPVTNVHTSLTVVVMQPQAPPAPPPVQRPPPRPFSFTESFRMTAGYAAGLLLTLIVIPGLCIWAWGAWERSAEQAKLAEAAATMVKAAKPYLAEHGLVRIDKRSEFRAAGDLVGLRGMAADQDGLLHSFVIGFRFGVFDDYAKLEFNFLSIDDEMVDSTEMRAQQAKQRRIDRKT